MIDLIAKQDPAVAEAVKGEIERQKNTLEMIASENFVSPAVLQALGSVLTNKYAEGYPGKRYYGGCSFVDKAEELAIERAKELFGADYVNVQPHSGSQANMAVYFSSLKPGDTILSMNLAHGGHLTHGHPVNFSGIFYKVVPYGVSKETETIDYDQVEALAKEHRPKMIVCGASAYPRQIDFERFRKIADEVGALLTADIAHPAGLVAAGLHPDPVPYCDFVTTTTHKTLRGPRGGMVMCKKAHRKALRSMVFPGIQGGPLMHVIAAKAVAFGEALLPSFKEYQGQIIKNAKALAEELINRGYKLVSGGTDNHLLLVDLSSKGLTGKDAEAALERAGITVNKNMVPFDEQSPMVTSGIRIGTPALTTRGMKEGEMKLIAGWIDEVLKAVSEGEEAVETACSFVRENVRELCSKFPLYS